MAFVHTLTYTRCESMYSLLVCYYMLTEHCEGRGNRRGILLLLTTPSLLNSVKPVLLKSLGLSTLVLVAMFFFTYFPLVAALAFVSGPLAFIGAIPVVLAETRVVSVFFSKFLFQAQGDKLFDAVLVLKGHEDLVQRGRTISFSASGVRTLGKSLLRPVGSRFSTVSHGVRFLWTR